MEPLTALVRGTPSPEVIFNEATSRFGSALCARVALQSQDHDVEMYDQHLGTITTAIANIDRYRSEFYERYQNLRLGFCIMVCVQRVLERLGRSHLKWFLVDTRSEGKLKEAMINLLGGNLERDVASLGMIMRCVRYLLHSFSFLFQIK